MMYDLYFLRGMAQIKLLRGKFFFRILRISIIPIIIFLFLSAVLYVYYIDRYKSRLIDGYHDKIKSSIKEIDASIISILMSSNIIMRDSSIEAISAREDALDPEFFINVISGFELLSYFRVSNPLIKNVYYYHVYNEMLVSSNGTEKVQYEEIKDTFIDVDYIKPIGHPRGSIQLSLKNNILSLVFTPLGIENTIDPLIIELSLEEIKTIMRQNSPSENSAADIYIRGFAPLFSSEHAFSEDRENLFVPQDSRKTSYSLRKKVDAGIEIYALFPALLWGETIVSTFIPDNDIRREFSFFAPIFSSILGTGVLIALTIAWIMSSSIYRPVNTIIQAVKKDGRAASEHTKESIKKEDLSTISGKIEELLEKNIKLNDKLTTLLPFACEHYILSIMNGTMISASAAKDFLWKNGIVFKNENFCVVFCTLSPTPSFLNNHHYSEIEHLSGGVFKLLDNLLDEDEIVFSIHLDAQKYALLFDIDKTKDEEYLKGKILKVLEIFEPDKDMFRIRLGIGRIYTGINGIRKSYDEARHAETVLGALNDEGIRVFHETGDINCVSLLNEDIHHLENYIEISAYEDAKSICDLIIEKNIKNNVSEETIKEIYFQFLFIAMRIAENRGVLNNIPFERNIMTLAASFKMLPVPDVREKTYEYLEIICDTLNRGPGKISPQKIIDYIKKNYSKEVYLDEMSARFGTSTSYLSRYFKQSVGVNFHRYLSNIRIDEAKKLLELTDRTISDIAQAVGFNNRNIFLRMFKKLEGLNPSEYRALVQQRNIDKNRV